MIITKLLCALEEVLYNLDWNSAVSLLFVFQPMTLSSLFCTRSHICNGWKYLSMLSADRRSVWPLVSIRTTSFQWRALPTLIASLKQMTSYKFNQNIGTWT